MIWCKTGVRRLKEVRKNNEQGMSPISEEKEAFFLSFLPSYHSALQLRVSFGLLNNLPPFFSIPWLIVWFLNNLVFMVRGC
jgi:hypothetical protein